VSVAPLADDESTELVTHLLSSRGLESAELTRVLDAADGNPLFLEQLLALNAELDADEPLLVPPTITALLAARLDQLGDTERRVLEAAAVEGRMFERAHVELLVDGEAEADVGAVLVALAQRQFVRPARGRRFGAEAFAFAHGLVRDATYASMPKERRARMHVELAGIRAGEGAHDEIVGLHLADAARLRQELGYLDDETNELGGRAARHLRSGGERALAMGDDGAAAKLFERAVELVGVDDPDGRMAQFQLGRALAGSGRLERAESSLQEVVSSARASGDRALELRADLALSNLQAQTDATISMAELRDRAEATLQELQELEDESGLTLAWWLLHWTDFRAARYSRSIDAAERTVEHAVRARERREELRALGAIAMSAAVHVSAAGPVTRIDPSLLASAVRLPAGLDTRPVTVVVLLAGNPVALVQETAGHSDLDQAAAEAVRRWRFEPARRGNDPVAMWVLLPVEFRLK